VIEKLTQELEARKADSDIVTELQNEISVRDLTIQNIRDELSVLKVCV
jgi:hypothetical protein